MQCIKLHYHKVFNSKPFSITCVKPDSGMQVPNGAGGGDEGGAADGRRGADSSRVRAHGLNPNPDPFPLHFVTP